MSLARRYAVAFLLVLLVSGAVLVVTFDAHRTDVAESTEAAVTGRAEQSATILDDRIQAHRRTVAVGATNPALAAHGTDRQRQSLEAFIDRSAFEGASVVDETGSVQALVTVEGESAGAVGTDIGDEAYVRRTLEGEQYVSDPFVAVTGNRVVAITAPIRADGEIVGALTGTYHLRGTDLFEPLRDERDATTVAANGELLFSSGEGAAGTEPGDENEGENGNADGVITAEAELETVDWTVTAHRDRSAITSPITGLAAMQVVSGVTLLGSVIAFGVWVYRSQVRRIGRLLERVRALERREYDGGPSISGAAEWRRIDDALARLGATLGRREQMLLVLNRILRHNLRNTLNVVIGRAGDLESSLDGDDREAAAEIRRTTRDLLTLADRARLTEELLDPVAVGGEDGAPRTDVAALVRERAAGFAADADEAGPRPALENVTVSGPDRAVAACGDEIAIAIDELLANVVDHAGASPTVAVTIDVDIETDQILVIVADDGPGIPADEVSVITGERAISQVNHTGGIGLWLVDWICSRYDGRLVIPRGTAADGDGRESGVAGAENGTESGADATDGRDAIGGGLQGATVVLELPLAPEAESDRAGGSVPAGV